MEMRKKGRLETGIGETDGIDLIPPIRIPF